ncbi:MAG TPA: alpha/beta hydrolase [Hellea balneolensis]|uniref:Alpha/beta hydrolase n=1 Tax=Hellea balneolensis TaxID=287478 RepID=A0A7V5NXM0_9PROT|nr:alpha/beta hydrolase [Hellea balneolensis]
MLLIRLLILLAVGFVFVLIAGSCAPVTVLNTITPSGSYKKAKDIPYGQLARQKLDIYQPDQAKPGAAILVFVHGGGWKNGHKDMYKFVGQAFAKQGYTTIIPNYRLYPKVKYPAFVEDTAKAVAFVARRYPDHPIVLMGHSAGAYNALMVATAPEYLKAEGLDVCKTLSGVIGLSGPYGALPATDEPYITIFPNRIMGDEAPLGHVSAHVPPLFLAIGSKDQTVSDKHSRELAAKVKAAGGEAVFKLYPGLSHIDAVKVLSVYFDGKSSLKSDITAFIDAHSRKQESYCP